MNWPLLLSLSLTPGPCISPSSQVGALCVMDTEPRDASQFTDVDRGILLDLAAAVSTVLREKEEAHARSNEMVRGSFHP